MRKTILILLTAMPGIVLAGWEQVGVDEAIYLFADRQTIRKDGRKARMSYLVDYKLRPPENGTTYQSARVEAEYDCDEPRGRDLSASFHPYRMGEGGATSLPGLSGEWQAIKAGSAGEILRNIACEQGKDPSGKKSDGKKKRNK